MPEAPTIVPPIPTVTQGQNLSDAAAADSIQKAFDRVLPEIKTKASQPATKPPEAPVTPTAAPEQPPVTPEPTPATPQEEAAPKLPSFLERILDVSPDAPVAPPASVDEFPEELPEFKTPEERKERYKKWREAYKNAKTEAETLRSRPILDDQTRAKMEFLENQNKEMSSSLNRFSVETHQDFQAKIIRPMHQAFNEAARIVRDAGGNPEDLGKALTLTGRNHFEALDTVFADLPESAKVEAHGAISAYRRLDEARKAAIADAPRTMENLRKADLQRQHVALQQQRVEMGNLFDKAIQVLRDEAGVELLRTSTDPDAKEWNERVRALETRSRQLYLDNTDMNRMAMACVLANLTDDYRKLWMQERKARLKGDKLIKERFGSEPSMSESGGNIADSNNNIQEDLKRPFKDVFLRELNKQRQAGVR